MDISTVTQNPPTQDGKEQEETRKGADSQGQPPEDTVTGFNTPLTLPEVDALIRYAVERSLDPKTDVLPTLIERRNKWQEGGCDARAASYKDVVESYASLVTKTKGVVGRTLLDSANAPGYMKGLVAVTALFVIMAVGTAAGNKLYPECPSQQGIASWLCPVAIFMPDLAPFIWGALGACVYMLKRLYDISVSLQFDAQLYRGWWVRVVLGAVLGGAVFQLFPTDTEVPAVAPTVLAFLAGLGVRVVYGAFERMIELLAEKMNIGTKATKAMDDAKQVLANELKNIDPKASPEKYQGLLEVLQKLGGGGPRGTGG